MISSTSTWRTGAPPESGWRIASTDRDPRVQRFYDEDSKLWSAPCFTDDPEQYKDRAKHTRGESQGGVRWTGGPL